MKKTISTLLIAACLSHTTFAASKTDIAHKVGLGVLATVAVIAGGSTMCLKAKSNRLEKEFEENNALLAKISSLLEAKNKEIALRDQALRVTSKQFKNIDARRTVRDENQKTSKKRYDIRKAARKARDQKIGLGDIKITNISPMSKDLELQFGSLSE